jgi:hypothetical protein
LGFRECAIFAGWNFVQRSAGHGNAAL